MVIMIEAIRNIAVRYGTNEDSRNSQEVKLKNLLSIALGVAKWINGFDPLNLQEPNEFEIPKELKPFNTLVDDTLGSLRNSTNKLPDVNRIAHSNLETESSRPNHPSFIIKAREHSSSPGLAKLRGGLPSRSVMMNYLTKNKKIMNTNLTRNYRPNLTIGKFLTHTTCS